MATRYNFFGGLVTDGMILDFDAAKLASYPAGGTAWIDISGNSNNGTIVNGPQFTGISKQAAFVFDGNDDYVVFPTSKMPFGNSQISYNAWTKWNGNGVNSNDFIIGYGNDAGPNLVPLMIIGPTGQMIFEFGSNSGAAATPFGITSGTWIHSCGTYNKSFSTIYLNGAPAATKAYSNANIGPSGSNGLNGAIGALFSVYGNVSANGPQRYGTFNGSIAQVQVYNRALSQFDVWQNFNAYKSRYGIPEIVTNGLVLNLDAGNPYSYYSPTSGTTWTDASENGNNGTLTNGPVYSNGDITFDGADDYISTNTNSSLTQAGNTQFTAEFWIKKSSAAADSIIGAWNNTGRKGWFLQWYSDSVIYFGITDGGSNYNYVTLGYQSQWFHIVGVFNGSESTSGTRNKIFVNGVQQSVTEVAQLTSVPTGLVEVTIGKLTNYSSFTTGSISAVKIYNRALSATEVQQNFQALRGRYGL